MSAKPVLPAGFIDLPEAVLRLEESLLPEQLVEAACGGTPKLPGWLDRFAAVRGGPMETGISAIDTVSADLQPVHDAAWTVLRALFLSGRLRPQLQDAFGRLIAIDPGRWSAGDIAYTFETGRLLLPGEAAVVEGFVVLPERELDSLLAGEAPIPTPAPASPRPARRRRTPRVRAEETLAEIYPQGSPKPDGRPKRFLQHVRLKARSIGKPFDCEDTTILRAAGWRQ